MHTVVRQIDRFHKHVHNLHLCTRIYSSCPSTHQKNVTITFLTDVEGDGLYFDRYINNSKVLGFRSRKPCFHQENNNLQMKWNIGQCDEHYFPYDREVIFLEEDGMLVYGGDVWDKGGADLYVIRQLLSLHDRYPHRVHFLMGNRDINKLRIVDELGVVSKEDTSNLPFHGGVYWLRGTNLRGDPDQTTTLVPHERTDRLKWMLQKTMGSADAFELRRCELERERIAFKNSTSAAPSLYSNNLEKRKTRTGVVIDDEVSRSYIVSCNPNDGIMSQYLSRAKLTIKFGSALFMHGALPFLPDKSTMCFPTPWLTEDEDNRDSSCKTSSLTDWIRNLNQFASDQIGAWQEYGLGIKHADVKQHEGVWATEGGYSNNTLGGKAFGKLLQYGMNTLPDKTKNQSIVYSSWMKDGLPREDIQYHHWCDFFEKHGLELIATGHQPVGDMPWPIQIQSQDNLSTKHWIIPCDTSFSGDTCWVNLDDFDDRRVNLGRGSGSSGRGDVAVCETMVRIYPSTSTTTVTLHGRLSDGSSYEIKDLIHSKDTFSLGKPHRTKPIKFSNNASGEQLGVFWSKASVGGRQLVSHGKAFNVWNALVSKN